MGKKAEKVQQKVLKKVEKVVRKSKDIENSTFSKFCIQNAEFCLR